MRKLTLNVDSLVVQSFQTTAPEAGRGTVHGQAAAQTPGCSYDGCVPTAHYSCDPTCPETCFETCDTCHTCMGSCPSCCWMTECNDTCKDTCQATCPWCVEPTDPAID